MKKTVIRDRATSKRRTSERQNMLSTSEKGLLVSHEKDQGQVDSTDIVCEKGIEMVDGDVCGVQDDVHDEELSVSPPPVGEIGAGLEVGRPSSCKPIPSYEASPDSGISQGNSCNNDELPLEKQSPMTIDEPTLPEIQNSPMRENHGPPQEGASTDQLNSNTTVRMEVEENRKTASTYCGYTTRSSDKDDAVSQSSSSASSTRSKHTSQQSPNITSEIPPIKPAQIKPSLTSDASISHASHDIIHGSAKPKSSLEKYQPDKDEDIVPQKMLTKSWQKMYSKVHDRLLEVKQSIPSIKHLKTEMPITSNPLSEKSESVRPKTRVHFSNSSKFKSSVKSESAETKKRLILESCQSHDLKCPSSAGCGSQDNECSSILMEPLTDSSSRPMLLRSNFKSRNTTPSSTRSPSPIFGKLSPCNPRIYKHRSQRGSTPLPKNDGPNDPTYLCHYSHQSCQTSASIPGSWPRNRHSNSSNASKCSTGPPKSLRMAPLDNRKTKGRVKLFRD